MIRVNAQPATVSSENGDVVIALEFNRQQLQRMLGQDNLIRLLTVAGIVELRLHDGVAA